MEIYLFIFKIYLVFVFKLMFSIILTSNTGV